MNGFVPALVDRADRNRRAFGLAALVAIVVVAMVLSAGHLAAIRVALPPLSRALSWLERVPGPFDMDHLLFFALVAAGARVLLPRMRWWWLFAGFSLLAIATELMQHLTSGRTPKLSDVRDNLAGTAVGLVLGALPLALAGQARWIVRCSCVALLAAVALLPLQQWPVGSLLGYPLLPSDALFLLAIVLRTLAWATGGAPVVLSGFHAWMAAYVFAMLLATLWLAPEPVQRDSAGLMCPMPIDAPLFDAALAKWIGILWLAGLAWVTCELGREAGMARAIVLAWAAAATAVATLSLAAAVALPIAPDLAWLQPLLDERGSGHLPRVVATFAHASMLSAYLLSGLCMVLAARASDWIDSRTSAIALTAIVLGSMPTLSPSLAALPLALGFAGWWVWRANAPARARFALLAGGLPSLAMLVLATRSLASPMTGSSTRWRAWEEGIRVIAARPWTGVGPGNDVVRVEVLASNGDRWLMTDVHQTWLSIAGQGGLPALIAFVGLVAWLLLRAWRARKSVSGIAETQTLALALTVGCQGLTASLEDARHLWVLMGLLAAVAPAVVVGYRQKASGA